MNLLRPLVLAQAEENDPPIKHFLEPWPFALSKKKKAEPVNLVRPLILEGGLRRHFECHRHGYDVAWDAGQTALAVVLADVTKRCVERTVWASPGLMDTLEAGR